MSVRWRANPELPGSVSDKLIVSSATFQINHFQIVADSGSAMHSKYLLTWAPGEGPAIEEFQQAPAGVYSKAAIDLGGSLAPFSYQIRGTWTDDGREPKSFTIEDSAPLSLQVDCNTVLSVPGSAQIDIKVDLGDPLSMVTFKDLGEDGGPIMISSQMNMALLQQFRTRLPHAFQSEE